MIKREDQDITKVKVLAVDDEPFNLDILSEYFENENYEVITATDGLEAINQLAHHPDTTLIVLDRMMPNMDGMEFLQRIKQDARYKDMPIIMQTAATAVDQIREGIEAGAYYYLAKPYHKEVLLSIVKAAANDALKTNRLLDKLQANDSSLRLMKTGTFEFRDLKEVQSLSLTLANCCSNERNVLWGITELMINSIEHGVLGLSYDQKKQMLIAGTWHDYIEQLLQQNKGNGKACKVEYSKSEEGVEIIISDPGAGFNWKKYMDIDPERIADPNGRGIALSRQISFDTMEYLGNGNTVKCLIANS